MSFEIMQKILINNWPMFVRGAGKTLLISIISTIIGAAIGLLIGVIRTIPRQERGLKNIILKYLHKKF